MAATSVTASPPVGVTDAASSVDTFTTVMENSAISGSTLIIALAVGALALVLLLAGLIVCAMRACQKQQEKCPQKEMGTTIGAAGTANRPNFSNTTENVYVDYVDPRPPSTMAQPLENRSLVMNPAALDVNPGFSAGRVVLNQGGNATAANTTVVPVNGVPPAGREVLNTAMPQVRQQHVPIVPEQATLLYPRLPTSNPGPIYPNLSPAQQNPYLNSNLAAQNPYLASNPVPENPYSTMLPQNPYPSLNAVQNHVPVAGTNGYLNPGVPVRQNLTYTDNMAVNPAMSTFPARGNLSNQVNADGYTVYPSSGASSIGY